MTSPLADGVMAATHKLVQQAMTGQWQDVPKTIAERQMLLERLSANATSQDQAWLSALKQAMAESDAAVGKMTQEIGNRESGIGSQETRASAPEHVPVSRTDLATSVLQMIASSR
jgi:hypothetical protein